MDERLSKKINAELENIDKVFEEIPSHEKLPYLSALELAGQPLYSIIFIME